MKKRLYDIAITYRSLLWYFCASGTTAVLDIMLVFALKSTFKDSPIVVINSISVILTTVIHYIWTSLKAFNVKLGVSSLSIYLITFAIGLTIQDLIIWLCYDVLGLLLLISKGISLASSFFILFFLRKTLFAILTDYQRG